MIISNFLPKQYKKDNKIKINHNYLLQQFDDYNLILKKISRVVRLGHYTLGSEVDKFEKNISKLLKSKYVVSVGSGTDAIMLSLKVAGVGSGDEVITTPFTFYATIGAICSIGAKPIFVDIKDDFNIDSKLIEEKINSKTKAIVPVHWAGRVCDMKYINKIAKRNKLKVIEDACHAIQAHKDNINAGNFGDFGCFSLHPLKNLNVWGDGGYILVKRKSDYNHLMLLRNHGLINRNTNKLFGYNSRLDTVQAVVANHLLKKISKITNKRIKNASYLDKRLKKFNFLTITPREKNSKEVFHLYCLKTKKKKQRDHLVKFLIKNKIDAKIHYPKPMHLQPAAKIYGYTRGQFPRTEKIANTIFSLPVHEFIKKKDLDKIVKEIEKFSNENQLL